VELKYPDETARAQARRCVRCGIHTIFDATRCILCGGCVDVCPEYCLRMVPVAQIAGNEAVTSLIQFVTGSDSAFRHTAGGQVRNLPAGRQAGPQSAISASRAAAPAATAMLMDATRCIRCALCAIRCPTGAISMEAFRYAEAWTSV